MDDATPRRRPPPVLTVPPARPRYRALVGLHFGGAHARPGQRVPDGILDALGEAGVTKFVRVGRMELFKSDAETAGEEAG